MGNHAQCPSTRGKRTPSSPRRDLARVGGTGQRLWRSPEEIADTPAFREFLEREFPAGASELLNTSRRNFLRVMGAGLALAGAATIPGCRRPDHKILPYSQDVPEEVVPGKPLYYATSMPMPGGGAEGLLVETHEGRPTKVEGNPLHPLSQGKSSAWAQASVLGLYDPDRLKHPVFRDPQKGPQVATWDDFEHWWKNVAGLESKFDASGGRGLALLIGRRSSPSINAVRRRLERRWPNAIFAVYEPSEIGNAAEGARIALGGDFRELLSFDKARVVVSLDRDFLNSSSAHEPNALKHARDFASMRRPMRAGDPMNRLYALETTFTLTGAQADHRLGLAPSRIEAAAIVLARRVLDRLGSERGAALERALSRVVVPEEDGLDAEFLDAAAEDLVAHGGEGLVVAGESQRPEIHALVHALNRVLGNAGATVRYRRLDPRTEPDEVADSLTGIRAVADMMVAGRLDTLICLECNPVYDAPADLDFASRFKKVPHTITLAVRKSETAEASQWRLNGAHFLESWGDVRSGDGTLSPIQPMIAPIFEPARSELEFLAWLTGDERYTEEVRNPLEGEDQPQTVRRVSGHRIVRTVWRDAGLIAGDFEKGWKRALHDGVVPGASASRGVVPLDGDLVHANVGSALEGLSLAAPPTGSSMEVVFGFGLLGDGRFANDAWLQELPATATRVVWDNPALVSPATAKRLDLMPESYTKDQDPDARVAAVRVNGRSIEIPVWIMPGMPDDAIVLTLGYGRTAAGRVGDGVGFDTYALRDSAGRVRAGGATLSRTSRTHFVASTQVHWSLEGRDAVVRQIDKPYYDEHAAEPVVAQKDEIYGRFEKHLNVAEQMGELSHTPPNVSIYDNPMNQTPGNPSSNERLAQRYGTKKAPIYENRPQWGMSIDMSTCTGCGVCTIACQSENNIPSVSKPEVAKGREMHWIRVDRYFTGDDWHHPEEMVHQPVACVQCENAPCETVCPVNATVHGPEGLNLMVYNRCIGTRYCSNNCPYKVRRFNFFDWGQTKFNGGFVGEQLGDPGNKNLIPPRLRERLDEIAKAKHNPDVTVRGRGVMEKCTYCLQRINRARYETKLKDLEDIPDGFFQTACQQACPSGSIVFGDLLDESSRVRAARDDHRSYLLLGYLNTRPRTTHMLRVRNPNPRLREPIDPLAGHHGGGHENGHGEGHDGEEHGLLHDPAKRLDDPGYAGTLRVLGAAMGVHA